MRKSNLPRIEIIDYLAECIKFAEDASGKSVTVNNDVYWYTRESVMEVAKQNGIRIPEILEWHKKDYTWNAKRKPDSNPFWLDVAHPSIILKEVHDS